MSHVPVLITTGLRLYDEVLKGKKKCNLKANIRYAALPFKF